MIGHLVEVSLKKSRYGAMAKRFIPVFLLCFLLSCSTVSTRFPASETGKSCFHVMNDLLKWQNNYGGHVEILWWPKAFTKVVSHSDIMVDNQIYSPFFGLTKVGDLEKKYNRAKEGVGKVFFRYRLNLSPIEYSRIKEIVNDPSNFTEKKLQTCVGGACKMLRQNTDLSIPFPFSQVPSLNALYLYTLKKLGHKKIVSVEYVGPNLWQSLLTYEPIVEVAALGGAIGGTIGLIVWSLNGEDELEATVVPIDRGGD